MESTKIVSRVVYLSSIFLLLIGVLSILGWQFNIEFLKRIYPNFIAIKPITAISFIMTGIASICLQYGINNHSKVKFLGQFLGFFIFMIGLISLLEYMFNLHFNIDHWFYASRDLGEPPLPAGRMSPISGLVFMLTGFSIMITPLKKSVLINYIIAVIIGMFGILILVGFSYHFVVSEYRIFKFAYAAIQTAVGFIFIAIIILCHYPKHGLVAILSSQTIGGKIFRWVLPVIVMVPLILGYLRVYGEESRWYDSITGIAILSVVYILLFGIIIASTIGILMREEIEKLIIKKKLQMALDAGAVATWELDVTSQLMKFDQGFLKLYGMINGNNTVKFDDWSKHIVTKDRSRVIEALQKSVENEEKFDTEFRILMSEGEQKYIHAIADVIKNELNQSKIVIGTSWDITIAKELEEKLNAAMKNLERSNKELEQFAYVASHDLQEPLRMVSSFTQLLASRYQDKLDQDAREFIGFAVDGAKRMQLLITDLLTYSRVTTRARPFEPVDCNDVIKIVLKNLEVKIKETGATIDCQPLPIVKADGIQIGQVFQNLITNAIKFCKVKPIVHIRCEEKETEWVFSISDNGIGIDPKYFEKIFIIFQRLNKKEEYPGSGMGLAICQKIIIRHGGKIWVESCPEKGSTFFFTLPK